MKCVLLFFSLFILLSCTTTDEQTKDIKPISKVYLEDIQELLDQGHYMKAVQDISYLRREEKDVDS